NYLNDYNIPKEILSPLNIEKDIDKIIKANGFTKDVIKIIDDNNLIQKYKEQIPYKYKFMFGILSKDEMVGVNEIQKAIYSSDGDKSLIESIFEFIDLNYVHRQTEEEFIEQYKSSNPI